MSYRGKDLDLRTADVARAGSDRQRVRARSIEPSDATDATLRPALYVDDAVLACCNHAYDLALAYRAPEVRLEHLINAMTRTDAAVAVMAAQGIDVTGLRHDTATLIAAEAPIIYAAERPTPRRSQDLADALQAASVAAETHRGPITVTDLLQTLLGMNREQSGLVMLKRNASGWPPRGPNETPRTEQLPPLLGGAYQLDPRYMQPEPRGNDASREWLRMPQAPAYYQAPFPSAAYQSPQPAVPALPQQGYYAPENSPPAGSVADVVQNSRLDQLERIIRDLTGELAGQSNRGGNYSASNALSADQFAGFERSVDAKFGDIARVWSALGDRLQALEHAVIAGRSDTGMPIGLVDKLQNLDELGQVLTHISERLAGLERQVSAKPAAVSPVAVNLQPVLDRLGAIDARITEVSRGASSLSDRIGKFETKLEAASSDRNATHWTEQLHAIEEAVDTQRGEIAALAANLDQSITAQKTSGERLHSLVGERFQGMTSAFDRQRSEIATAVTQPLNDRMSKLSGLLDSHRVETAQTIAGVSDKIGALDKLMQTFGQRTLDLHAAHGKDLVELHNALVKLNTNQQTLAASMDQWRLDNGTEFSNLANRFESIEKSIAQPVQMLATIQESVQTLQKTSAKREEQKSRFRHWLMGTDDWYGASWEQPAAAASVRSPGSNGKAAASLKDNVKSVLRPYGTPKF